MVRQGWAPPPNLARAAVEGMPRGVADGMEALVSAGLDLRRVLLVGGGSRSPSVRTIASTVLGRPVTVPIPAEYTALGAARVLTDGEAPPERAGIQVEVCDLPEVPEVRMRHAAVRDALP